MERILITLKREVRDEKEIATIRRKLEKEGFVPHQHSEELEPLGILAGSVPDTAVLPSLKEVEGVLDVARDEQREVQ